MDVRVFSSWLLLICLLLTPPSWAQSPADWNHAQELDPVSSRARLLLLFVNPHAFEQDAFPGRQVQFKVRVEALAPGDVTLQGCKQTYPKLPPEGTPPPLNLTSQLDSGPLQEGVRFVTTYLCTADIADGAEPRTYRIGLTLHIVGQENVTRYVDLPVGLSTSTRLQLKTANTEPLTLILGTTNHVPITVVNNYPDYPVHIRWVRPSSPVDGLIRRYADDPNAPPPLTSGGAQDFDLVVKTGIPISALMGLTTDNPVLNITAQYDDGYRQPIQSSPPMPIPVNIVFNPVLAFVTIPLGILLGGVPLRWLLKRVGRLGPRERGRKFAAWIGVWLMLGMIAALLAVVFKPEVLLFGKGLRVGYDNPLYTFLVGVAIPLSDPDRILNRLRSLIPTDGAAPSPPVNAGKP